MLTQELQQKIDFKTKPTKALGLLESIAHQIGMVQQSLSPSLNQPTIVVFAGDHGVAQAGVSAYPQEVTFQMVMNFLQGGAAINVFSKQHGIALHIVDAGVNYNFDPSLKLVHQKIGKGTANFIETTAMTKVELQACLEAGKTVTQKVAASGSNIIGFGEMGIGNTSAAAMLMSYLCDLPIVDCVGRGTGLDDSGYQKKIALLQKAQAFHGAIDDTMTVLQTFGGFEIAQMVGAMLAAYDEGMTLMIDGFISTSAYLVAYKLNPDIQKNALFCHLSDESGHLKLLQQVGGTPILKLNMRLGEGSGCAVAYPIIQSAVDFLNQMASFESAGVSNKE